VIVKDFGFVGSVKDISTDEDRELWGSTEYSFTDHKAMPLADGSLWYVYKAVPVFVINKECEEAAWKKCFRAEWKGRTEARQRIDAAMEGIGGAIQRALED